MVKPKPPSDARSPEAELAGLVATRANLQARQAAIAIEVEKAVATRRQLLIEGGDTSALADAERACRETESTAFGISDALAEVERRIRAAETRIEEMRATTEIEAVAGGLERNAVEIEKATAGLAKALAEVAKAHAGLAITISGAAAGQFDPIHGPAGPVAIANALLLRGLAHAMPGLEVQAEVNPWSMYAMRGPVEGADPVAVAAEFGQRLRETAAKVRSREIGHELIAGQDLALPQPVSLEEVQIFVVHPFQYHRKADAREMVTSHITHVPRPVAERAIELGVAAANETAEWRRTRRPVSGNLSATTTSYGWDDCVDIDFDLDAWLADQRQAA